MRSYMVHDLFLVTLWSSAVKGLTSWLTCVCVFSCYFATFSYGFPCQRWYLIASIPDLFLHLYFEPTHDILLLMAYAQNPHLYPHADVFNKLDV